MKNDTAKPSEEEADEALAKSRKYWHLIGSVAHALQDHGLLPEYTDPRLSLRRVPKFQAQPKDYHCSPQFYSRRNLIAKASSVWKVTDHGECDGLKKEVVKDAYIKFASGASVPVKLDGEVFATWIGTTEEAPTDSNYISILTLGWCYILSARLIELQGKGATLRYTESQAGFDGDSTLDYTKTSCVDLGEVDDDIARWWSAILAPNQGWKAVVMFKNYVKDKGHFEHVTPWSVSRKCATSFFIKHKYPPSDSVFTPLSANKAFEALSEFALSHGVGSQFSIALATALMIPLNDYWRIAAHLPAPRTKERQTNLSSSIDSMPLSWKGYMEDIDYYISLSCHVEMMYAALCGSFWEPEVPCNLVSPWLHPVLNEVISSPESMTACEQELLGLISAIRRPSIAALSIGAIITGLGPKILHSVEAGHPDLNQYAYPWIGSPVCFMDFTGTGPYTCENPEFISRQDVWRLLHLQTTDLDDFQYTMRPFSGGWAPCGISPTKNCDLQVASHLNCPRHEYQYDHWTWITKDGTTVDDYGASRDLSTPMPGAIFEIVDTMSHKSFEHKKLDPDQEASENATFQAFIWFLNSGNGAPQEKVWEDEWVNHLLEDQDEDSLDDTDEQQKKAKYDSERQDRVQSWVDSVQL